MPPRQEPDYVRILPGSVPGPSCHRTETPTSFLLSSRSPTFTSTLTSFYAPRSTHTHLDLASLTTTLLSSAVCSSLLVWHVSLESLSFEPCSVLLALVNASFGLGQHSVDSGRDSRWTTPAYTSTSPLLIVRSRVYPGRVRAVVLCWHRCVGGWRARTVPALERTLSSFVLGFSPPSNFDPPRFCIPLRVDRSDCRLELTHSRMLL